jgi:hypothetical protein
LWTAATGLTEIHCRRNDRLHCLSALKQASKFEPAFEVPEVDQLDAKRGRVVGRYRTRPRRARQGRRWRIWKMTVEAVWLPDCVTLTLVRESPSGLGRIGGVPVPFDFARRGTCNSNRYSPS